MKGKGRKAIQTQQEEENKARKRKKEKKKDEKKMKKKEASTVLGFEPETTRLAICSLNNYATEQLMLNPRNCQLCKSDLQPASWLT